MNSNILPTSATATKFNNLKAASFNNEGIVIDGPDSSTKINNTTKSFDLYKDFITTNTIITDYKNVDYINCPKEIKYDMLKNEFNNSIDFQCSMNNITNDDEHNTKKRNVAWQIYSRIMFSKNVSDNPISIDITGFKTLSEDETIKISEDDKTKAEDELVYNENEKSITNSFVGGGRYNSKRNNKSINTTILQAKKNRSTCKNNSKKSINKTIIQTGGGNLILNEENYPSESYLKLTTIPNTSMYVMQIPDNSNRFKLLQMYAYLRYDLNIKIIYDLHSCGTGLHPSITNKNNNIFEGCAPKDEDIKCERETWEFLKKLNFYNNNENMAFIDEFGIKDFTGGTLISLTGLLTSLHSRIDPMHSDDSKFVIHCQSGHGRSLFVCLLFHISCDFEVLTNNASTELVSKAKHCYLIKPYMGFDNSKQMFNFLSKKLFIGYSFYNNIMEELFGTKSMFNIRLLISRINLILASLYAHLNMWGTLMFLYDLPDINNTKPTRTTLFIPIQVGFQSSLDLTDDKLTNLNFKT